MGVNQPLPDQPDDGSASIAVRVCGRVSVRDASGSEITRVSRQPQQLALLAVIALSADGQSLTRDRLVAMFWPDLPTDRARGSLRTALSRLRADLGPAVLAPHGASELAIAEGRIWCDARALRETARHVAAGVDVSSVVLAQRLADYRGPFLHGFHVAGGSNELEEWISSHRREVGGEARTIAMELASRALREDDLRSAVRYGRQACTIDPLDEPATRLLMTALARAGDLAGAHIAYQAMADRLVERFGAAPSPATQRVRASLQSIAPPALAPFATAGPPENRSMNAPTLPGMNGLHATESRRPPRATTIGVAAVLTLATAVGLLFDKVGATNSGPTIATGTSGTRAPAWHAVRTSEPSPLAREQHIAALDASGDRALVLSGRVRGTLLGDIWEIDGLAAQGIPIWSRRSIAPGDAPTPRWMQASAYDAAGDRLLVFGGGLGFSSPCTNEAWLLEDALARGTPARWVRVTSRGDSPEPRADARGAFDIRGSFVVFGGHDCVSKTYDDVFMLRLPSTPDGIARWERVAPVAPAGAPGARRGHSLVYDPVSDRAIVFGGLNASLEARADTWLLIGVGDSSRPARWQRLDVPGPAPLARGYHAAVFDPGTNRMVVYAGFDPATGVHDDAWVLVGANGTSPAPAWQRLVPKGSAPLGRLTHAAMYDSRHDRMIIHGGQRSGARLGDLWILTSATGR